ncbi:CBPM Carboxypeptidase, partial [Polypterus senegalus]
MMNFLPGCWCLAALAYVVGALDFQYHNSKQVADFLSAVSRNYSSFTYLHSIGKSVQGIDLWVLVLGRYPLTHKIGIPEFKYVGNMHGDEVVSREVLLHLIDYLVSNFGKDAIVTNLINSARIHIMPSMNPDGFDASLPPDCTFSNGRYNKNGFDLNRNFPDAFIKNTSPIQPETQAVMDWINNETFVLSANLHGGAVVASYPYDNSDGGSTAVRDYSISPDNDVFIHLAKTYSFNHTVMYKGDVCDSTQTFPDGITNGFNWYPVEGVKGQVLSTDGSPIPNAVVEVEGRSNICPYKTNQDGEYYRLLLPGNYTLKEKEKKSIATSKSSQAISPSARYGLSETDLKQTGETTDSPGPCFTALSPVDSENGSECASDAGHDTLPIPEDNLKLEVALQSALSSTPREPEASCNEDCTREAQNPKRSVRTEGIAKEPSFHSKKKVPYYRSQVSRSFVWDQTQGSEPYFEDDRAAIREFQHKVKTPDAPRMDRIPRSLSNEERPYSAPPANKAKMDGGHSQKRDSKNLQSGVHRSLQKKAGLRSADLKNMGHATEYQRQYFWKMLPEASPVLSAEQLIAKRTESPFRVTPMIHETEYTRSFRGSAHSKGLRLRTDHENETEVHEPENISPVKKSKLTEDRRKDYMGAKPSAVVSETEYTKSFKGSPPVKGLRLRKDIEINEEMNSHPESMKLPKSTKKCEHSPKEDDSPLVPEKQILKVQNPQKPFFPHRSRSRRMKSEYNDNFRSPTDYCYSKGAWRKHTHHRGEVNELKERAYAYKRRALGTHFSRDHLNQIVSNKNAFWEVSTSNSEESVSDNIRALDLARPQDLKKHKRQTKLDDPSTGENHACIEKLSIKDNEKKVSGSVHPVRRKLAWDEVKDHSEMAEEEKKEDHAVEVENLEKEQNQDHVEDNSEAAADIDVKVKEVKAEAEPSVRSISEDSASSSSNNHEEGRLPTPRMKLFGGVRRTHHDLTTPSYDDRMSQLSARSAASSSLASLVLERAQKRKETFWNTRLGLWTAQLLMMWQTAVIALLFSCTMIAQTSSTNTLKHLRSAPLNSPLPRQRVNQFAKADHYLCCLHVNILDFYLHQVMLPSEPLEIKYPISRTVTEDLHRIAKDLKICMTKNGKYDRHLHTFKEEYKKLGRQGQTKALGELDILFEYLTRFCREKRSQ